MQLKEMLSTLEFLVDDTIDAGIAVSLLNIGQNKMATEVNCAFPQLTVTGDLLGTFVFDEKYHEIPVLYVAAMIKSADTAVQEKNSYLGQFGEGLQNFAENYDPPVRYRVGPNYQQFTATTGQTVFTITKNDYSYKYGNLKVFVNDLETVEFDKYENTFTLVNSVTITDVLTAYWEIHAEYISRPYNYPGW